ncbi:uncharacterized protein [Sylvia atricapilla]|uniref:uncharacterized protein n=1 Tax=Sylvia atricapilla TaxID=48155 RepID=UPI0033964E2E
MENRTCMPLCQFDSPQFCTAESTGKRAIKNGCIWPLVLAKRLILGFKTPLGTARHEGREGPGGKGSLAGPGPQPGGDRARRAPPAPHDRPALGHRPPHPRRGPRPFPRPHPPADSAPPLASRAFWSAPPPSPRPNPSPTHPPKAPPFSRPQSAPPINWARRKPSRPRRCPAPPPLEPRPPLKPRPLWSPAPPGAGDGGFPFRSGHRPPARRVRFRRRPGSVPAAAAERGAGPMEPRP